MLKALQSFVSLRFLKFCTVGMSGVVVNLAFLAFFSDVMLLQVNLASALAIEMSINSNFLINEFWTFRDRHVSDGCAVRWLKFHFVSLVGGAIQWLVFIGCNLAVYMVLGGGDRVSDAGADDNHVCRFLIGLVIHPPDVGSWKYLSQLIGIGAATFWNYIVNFNWTWARGKEATDG